MNFHTLYIVKITPRKIQFSTRVDKACSVIDTEEENRRVTCMMFVAIRSSGY